MIEKFTKLIEDAGGYVNPDLKLLVGDEAKHGMVSLEGVDNDVLSIIAPYTLAEPKERSGPWIEFLESLGYNCKTDDFFLANSFNCGFMPLLGAANHNENGGKLVESKDSFELYGIDFTYHKGAIFNE